MAESELQRAIVQGLHPGEDLAAKLYALSGYEIDSPEDAEAVCEALPRFPGALHPTEDSFDSPLHALVALFQDVASQEAFDVLSQRGVEELLRIFDALHAAPGPKSGDLVFILKILAMYESAEGISRIVAAACDPECAEGYLWSVVFGQFDDGHAYREQLCDELRDPLPVGFARAAYLDFANQMAIEGDLPDHPFDSPLGKRHLESWLLSAEPEEYGYGHSAATSVPFMSAPERDQLLALALDHADPVVQMEAAWAAVKLGREPGVKFLARLCLDPHFSKTACAYLRELDHEDAIPKEAEDEDFQASAEMCNWLSHPSEFGRPPDEIELFDAREIHWPPTEDRRRVWLFRYCYHAEPGGESDEGIGMVGSITFAFFGEERRKLTPEDLYALHCCWELQFNDDPRAPEERSVEA
ncbi:MAG: HEAT repeat domain-containing protein, partial [Planctomycetales bacterium]